MFNAAGHFPLSPSTSVPSSGFTVHASYHLISQPFAISSLVFDHHLPITPPTCHLSCFVLSPISIQSRKMQALNSAQPCPLKMLPDPLRYSRTLSFCKPAFLKFGELHTVCTLFLYHYLLGLLDKVPLLCANQMSTMRVYPEPCNELKAIKIVTVRVRNFPSGCISIHN